MMNCHCSKLAVPHRILGGLALALILASTVLTAPARGAEPPQWKRLEISPPQIRLDFAEARQRVLVLATRADGITADVTTRAKLTVADPTKVKLDGTLLASIADGETLLRAEHAGLKAEAAVKIVAAGKARPVSFKLDVMPVFLRGGCNSGACHGSARGQDGFRLSLFGFDPDGDHFRLTREIPHRRVNLSLPSESLLLEKAIGGVAHTGGKRFETTSPYYRTLLTWLENGAPADPQPVAKVERIELFPPQLVLLGKGVQQPMVVRAVYADGTQRDVTSLALFLSNNDNSATIGPEGQVTSGAPGEAFVMARFDTHTVGSQVLVLDPAASYRPPDEKPVNYIDELVGVKLRKLRVVPAAICSDAVFLRRVTLDVVGLPPTPAEYHQFAADRSPDKRAKLIDRLLARKEFAEIWAMNWAELLMVRSNNDMSYKSTFLYSNWLTEQIAQGVPVDELARKLLSASGGTFRNPAANFYEVEKDTLKTAENVAQVFLGIRVQCAQCHNHPFDRWTMNDYYSFAAWFAQIGRKPAEDYRETIVFNRGSGEVRHLLTNQVMPPKFLGGAQPDIAGKDRREVLAAWLTAPDNPYFAPSIANRIWAYFFGGGIIEPVDDFRISNPPSNPELLAALGKKLVEYRYDFRRMVRDICNSHAYQRASRRDGDLASQRNFAEARLRRLKAELLLDSITQITETKDKFRGLPLGARAVQIPDGTTNNFFLTTFGRTPRETVCACDVRTEPTLSQSLHLLNGDTVQQKVRAGDVVGKLLAARQTPAQIVDELYLRCLCRPPVAEEQKKLLALIEQNRDKKLALEDVFWSLLNSREFVFNH